MRKLTFISEKPDEYPVILRPEFDEWYYSEAVWWWEPHPWGAIDFFSLCDKDKVLHDLQNNNAYLVVDFSNDAPYIEHIEKTHLKSILELFDEFKIPPHRLIVITGAPQDYFNKTSIKAEVEVLYKHLTFNPFWFNVKRNYLRNHMKTPDKKISVPYFCMMRKDTNPRRLVNYMLHYYKIHGKGCVSHVRLLDNHNSELDSEKFLEAAKAYSHKTSFIHNLYKEYAFLHHFIDIKSTKTSQALESRMHDPAVVNPHAVHSAKSFVELLVETDNIDRMFVTEKNMKSILRKNIFIVYNTPRCLEYLKSLGFKTFSHCIDESYDLIEDDYDRLEAIVKELKRICSLPLAQLQLLYDCSARVIEHNYNHYLSNDWTFDLSKQIENHIHETTLR